MIVPCAEDAGILVLFVPQIPAVLFCLAMSAKPGPFCVVGFCASPDLLPAMFQIFANASPPLAGFAFVLTVGLPRLAIVVGWLEENEDVDGVVEGARGADVDLLMSARTDV